jgi:transcriptional regulator with XRE-family HTH domain
MLDDLAGKRTGERIQSLRERKGLTRPVLAGLVGMSASWLKGIEQGRRLFPRLPALVIAVLAGIDMDIGGATSVPVGSFARVPHDAVARDSRRRLPAGSHFYWTMFGASNVALHAVSVSADLSRSQEARNRAEQIDPADIPSRERRGRLGVEIARTYHQRQDYPATLHWLEEAYQTSADSVRYSPAARQMASETVDHGGPLISR